MSADHVLEVLRALRASEVGVSIEGGWGVDALLGHQTRDHSDLDLAVALDDCGVAASRLAALGYRHDPTERPGLPARLVLKTDADLKVDVHPLTFDSEGHGWQELDEGGWYLHEARLLWREGMISGQPVTCIAPELQLASGSATHYQKGIGTTCTCSRRSSVFLYRQGCRTGMRSRHRAPD